MVQIFLGRKYFFKRVKKQISVGHLSKTIWIIQKYFGPVPNLLWTHKRTGHKFFFQIKKMWKIPKISLQVASAKVLKMEIFAKSQLENVSIAKMDSKEISAHFRSVIAIGRAAWIWIVTRLMVNVPVLMAGWAYIVNTKQVS